MREFLRHSLAVCFLAVGITASAQVPKPTITKYDFGDQTMISRMSDNGLYGVTSGACLVDLTTHESISVNDAMQTASTRDVSNDGTIIVGSVSSRPAYRKNGQWEQLPTSGSYIYGSASSVTPDGHYAAGTISKDADGFHSKSALWDLTTGEMIETPGLPTKDQTHQDQGMIDFRGGISADGNILLGSMSFSYLPSGAEDSGGCCWFVYYRDTQTYEMIGFKASDTEKWTPLDGNISFISDAVMSNNGRYISGDAYCTIDDGSEWGVEYEVPFLYDTQAKTFEIYDETMAQGTTSFAVSNNGTVTSSTPTGTPIREWSIYSGKYWFSLAEVMKQKYSEDFYSTTGLDNTGTAYGIADDCKRVLAFPDPYSSYIIDLPEPLETVCDGMKLLGSYTVSPVEGSEISHLKTATILFDRNVKTVGGADEATIIDETGQTLYNSIGFSASGKTVTVKFRKGTMEEGMTYTLHIPSGAVVLEDDATQANDEINIDYVGRADEPVQMTSVLPADNSTFSKIDYSTNPIILSFDTDVKLSDSASASLYRNDEADPYCGLICAYSGNRVALYPSTTQYLFDGSTYTVVLNAGSVTDVAGNNSNEEITLHYNGNYVREISSDDVILFSDNFDSGYGNFMMWCGDQNTPTADMTNWDFTKGMAWGLVRDDESSADRIAASHSMYDPAGQSDDWLVTPQLYIPDMLCSVKFLSQSYLQSKEDVLKVVVWESNNVYNTLNDDIISRMKTEGKVVYEKVQNPGEKEEVLAGDWTENSISLADFAGKNIYIAFVNENNNQSAIFMDSLQVRHDMDFLVTMNYDTRVVNKESAMIKGTITNNSLEKTYNNLIATLKDEEGNTIDTYTASNLNLRNDENTKFEFTKPLALETGVSNTFTVLIDLDGEQNSIKGSIDNLVFEPVKRVVLEEYTGRNCGNCPLGILGIEKLEARYGNQFLPIAIHTYGSDPLGNGLGTYTSTLGLNSLGAPSAIINRTNSGYPSVSLGDGIHFFFSAADAPTDVEPLWADYVAEELETPATSDITVSLDYDGNQFIANCDVCYALNASNLNVNLFTVLLEDNVLNGQENYLAAYSSEDLGEFGLGGEYGQSVIQNYPCMDVCRNVVGLTINGTGGYIPSSVEAGEHYTAQIPVSIPASVQSVESCKVIVMMIDNNTGKVINAARAGYADADGVESLTTALSQGEGAVYNLAGQRVGQIENGKLRMENSKGVFIVNGRKQVIR